MRGDNIILLTSIFWINYPRARVAIVADITHSIEDASRSEATEMLHVGSCSENCGSMDGSTTIKQEMLVSGGEENSAAKKATLAAKLVELTLIDPKRAKRQSAARSKERKMRYIAELERKAQTLQTEATTMSAQCSILRRDTNGLNAENNELKLRLQTIEQQVHLQDALSEALKEEILHLKRLTGQAMPNGGPMTNFSSSSSFGVGVSQPCLVALYIQVQYLCCLVTALGEALKEEIQHLKRLTGQAMPNGGPMTNFSSSSSFGVGVSQPLYTNNQKMHSLLTAQQQFQQMQNHCQKQQLQFQPHQQQHLLNQLKQQPATTDAT